MNRINYNKFHEFNSQNELDEYNEVIKINSADFDTLSDRQLLRYYIALANKKLIVIDDLIKFDSIIEDESYSEVSSILLFIESMYFIISLDYTITYVLISKSDKNIITDAMHAYYFEDYILVKFRSNSVDECVDTLDLLPHYKALSINIYMKKNEAISI